MIQHPVPPRILQNFPTFWSREAPVSAPSVCTKGEIDQGQPHKGRPLLDVFLTHQPHPYLGHYCELEALGLGLGGVFTAPM